MEYLVTMTTHVPAGTADDAVDAVRAREAEHTRFLISEKHLLRLWRPPLKPGEWRTLGLFAAADDDDLHRVLASMPLRVWRTDEVTPLRPHPNDPGRERIVVDPDQTEFLTTFAVRVPADADGGFAPDTLPREATRTAELAAEGHLIRLWRLPGEDRNLGHWQAHDAPQLRALLASLPMAPWLTVEVTPLSRHPSDPLAVRTTA